MIKIVNAQDIPHDLPPGKYNTRVVRSYCQNDDVVIELEFIGTPYERFSCLIPLIKEAKDGTEVGDSVDEGRYRDGSG
jgi:hypothetical protein